MFKKFTAFFVKLFQKYLPDAYLFAVILTIIVFIAAMISTSQGPVDMIAHWGNGFWSLLAFAMQMALIVVTGYVLADTKPVTGLLDKLAGIPKTPRAAIWFITFVTFFAMFLNWGFGLVVGPIFAQRIAKKVKGVDYRLLIASGYSVMAIWHGGFSGSIPLLLASGGETLTAQTAGAVTEAIPIAKTIFAPWNLIMLAVLLVLMPLVNMWMHPNPEEVVEIDPKLLEEKEVVVVPKNEMSPAEKLENSPILSMIIGLGGIGFIVYWFANKGFNLDLNIVNFIFLFVGIILHGTPKRFLDSVASSVRGVAGVLVQFPFYAGIMGMMTGANKDGASLAKIMSEAIVNVSTVKSFPAFSFLGAGVVNFFVPSGGGQWAVQAPVMMPSGAALGVRPEVTAMSIAWGDAWTNLIQPFWALPALGIAGLGARDIMGYCILNVVLVGIVVMLGFLLLV